ncbi:hypothetical protein HMPREF9182_1941 [Streptococcus sp. oral taxon 056 str. F0418]|nr:hypothetical protein HMPREF9182_1941 [Streptococcus sp. oral taxon 056 str. F0418]
MEQLNFITNLLGMKFKNINLLNYVDAGIHKEIISKLDYATPSCPACGSQMKEYNFQKTSKIPYLETTGMSARILLKKRCFKCYLLSLLK